MAESKLCLVPGFSVHYTLDDRGGIGDLVGYFTDDRAAKVAARGKGWFMGVDGTIDPVTLLHDPESDQWFALAHPEPIQPDIDLITAARVSKEQALEKARSMFTPHELALLGIKV